MTLPDPFAYLGPRLRLVPPDESYSPLLDVIDEDVAHLDARRVASALTKDAAPAGPTRPSAA